MFHVVDGLLSDAVDAGVFPGTSICIRRSAEIVHTFSCGLAEVRPNVRVADDHTVWDLASLTKALATTPVAMVMVQSGVLDLDLPVCEVLPDVAPGITARHLLSHSSGMLPWLPMAQNIGLKGAGTKEVRNEVLRLARTAPVRAQAGTTYAYSDLGFMTLCALMEKLTNKRFDELYERMVRTPSQTDLRFGWPNAAATEECPIRGALVRGDVHDLNAWLMGGISTHAGLFGTATDVAAAAAWQLRAWSGDDSEGLSADIVREFWEYKGPGSHHLGWDGVSENSSAGPEWPKDGVGHLGFTGCSVWIAPRQDLIVSWTTNRVHPEIEGGAVPDAPPSARYQAFRALRPKVHSAVIGALKAGWGN